VQGQGPEREHQADAVVLELLHREAADQMETLAAAHLRDRAQTTALELAQA